METSRDIHAHIAGHSRLFSTWWLRFQRTINCSDGFLSFSLCFYRFVWTLTDITITLRDNWNLLIDSVNHPFGLDNYTINESVWAYFAHGIRKRSISRWFSSCRCFVYRLVRFSWQKYRKFVGTAFTQTLCHQTLTGSRHIVETVKSNDIKILNINS